MEVSARKLLAEDKGLPEEAFARMAVTDNGSVVYFKYHGIDGEIGRTRVRSGLKGSDSRWTNDEHPIMMYGLWQIRKMARKVDDVILLEGETDTVTLCYSNIFALGIPGANMTKTIELKCVEQFSKLFIWQEADDAGSAFVNNCIDRLNEVGYRGEVRVITAKTVGFKDANDLYKSDPSNFVDKVKELKAKSITAEQWELETWEEPLPFDSYNLDPLPIESLPDWAKQFVELVSNFTQTPPCMSVLLFLSATATAVANKGVVLIKEGYSEPLCIWTASVLPPASRKSPVFKAFTEPVSDYEQSENEKTRMDRMVKIEEKEILEGRLKKMKKAAIDGKSEKERADSQAEAKKILEELEAKEIPPVPVKKFIRTQTHPKRRKLTSKILPKMPKTDIHNQENRQQKPTKPSSHHHSEKPRHTKKPSRSQNSRDLLIKRHRE